MKLNVIKSLAICIVIVTLFGVVGCSNDTSQEKSNGASRENATVASTDNQKADKKEETSKTTESEKEAGNNLIEMTEEIKNGAAEAGVSPEEMLDIIKIRIEKDSIARNISVNEYVQLIKDNGSTPYQAVKEAADMMEMGIVEYHQMLQDIQTAPIDGELTENHLPEGYPEEQLPLVKVKEIRTIMEDDGSYFIAYYSEEKLADLKAFYDAKLNGTDGYKLSDYETAIMIRGTIDGKSVKVDLASLDENDTNNQVNIDIKQ